MLLSGHSIIEAIFQRKYFRLYYVQYFSRIYTIVETTLYYGGNSYMGDAGFKCFSFKVNEATVTIFS